MISITDFNAVVDRLRVLGFADDDIEWSENIGPPTSPEDFALEAIYVICNSGMKNTIARKIYERVRDNLKAGISAQHAFGHKGKSAAIDRIWGEREKLWADYLIAADKVAFCASLPWIGDITKYHLAKNFGADVVKPDVHLQRLADHHCVSPVHLCQALAVGTGFRVATIDTLLWRACANGVIDSRSGKINIEAAA